MGKRNQKEVNLENLIKKVIEPKFSFGDYLVFVNELFGKETHTVQFEDVGSKDIFKLAEEMERLFIMMGLRGISIRILTDWGKLEINGFE